MVIRHLRFRHGAKGNGGDCINPDGGANNLIIDHCDVMFSADENLSSFRTAPPTLTFQWSTNAWGIYGHSCGGLWLIDHATAHHTLWANNKTRNPKVIFPKLLDWTNNVTFGWDIGMNLAGADKPGIYKVNLRGNSFIRGSGGRSAIFGGGVLPDGTMPYHVYLDDCALDGNGAPAPDITAEGYALIDKELYHKSPKPFPQTLAADPSAPNDPIIGVPVKIEDRRTAYKKIISQVGPLRPDVTSHQSLRDEVTTLLVNDVVRQNRRKITNEVRTRPAQQWLRHPRIHPRPAGCRQGRHARHLGKYPRLEPGTGRPQLPGPGQLLLPARHAIRLHPARRIPAFPRHSPRHARQGISNHHRPPEIHLRLHQKSRLQGLRSPRQETSNPTAPATAWSPSPRLPITPAARDSISPSLTTKAAPGPSPAPCLSIDPWLEHLAQCPSPVPLAPGCHPLRPAPGKPISVGKIPPTPQITGKSPGRQHSYVSSPSGQSFMPDTHPAPDEDTHALFVRLLSSSHRRLLGYLISMLGRREDAEDVLQRASVTLWRRFDTFTPGTDFLAWASTVCFYEAKNFQRMAARSKLVFSDALLEVLAHERIADIPAQDARIHALRDCLAKLDDSGRMLLEAAYLDRTNIGHIASQLGRAPQTLYNKLNTLRRLLAECIEQRTAEAES